MHGIEGKVYETEGMWRNQNYAIDIHFNVKDDDEEENAYMRRRREKRIRKKWESNDLWIHNAHNSAPQLAQFMIKKWVAIKLN